MINWSWEYVVNTSMRKLKIKRKDAEQRIDGLIGSGLLDGGDPEDRYWQLTIDNWMRFDPKKLDYMFVFHSSMAFPEYISHYDKREGGRLAEALKDMYKEEYDFEFIKKEIKKFDSFLYLGFWKKMCAAYNIPFKEPVNPPSP